MAEDKRTLRDILLFSKDDFEAMLRAAVEAYGEGNYARAETILVGLMKLDETDARPVKLLASSLMLMDRHRDAEAIYQLAYELDPQDPYTIVALAEIKLKSFKISECLPLFEQLFQLDPEGTHPAANRGRQLVQDYYGRLATEKSA